MRWSQISQTGVFLQLGRWKDYVYVPANAKTLLIE